MIYSESSSRRLLLLLVILAAALGACSGKRDTEAVPAVPADSVADMVSQVSQSNIQSFVEQLVAISPRPASTAAGYAAATFIADTFTNLGAPDVSFQEVGSGAYSPNVIVTITGVTSPSVMYVAGAHYDSDAGSPGADDNASGMGALAEMVRILSQFEFETTIVLIAFSAEEVGLVGSDTYAASASGSGCDIRGVINLDMLGYVAGGDTEDLDLVYHPSCEGIKDSVLAARAAYVPAFTVKTFNVLSIPPNFASDHHSFWDYGFAACFFHEDVEQLNPCRTNPSIDLLGTSLNSYSLLVNATRTAVAAVASLAKPVE